MRMMEVILHLYDRRRGAGGRGRSRQCHARGTGLFDKLVKMKYEIPNDQPEMFDEYDSEMDDAVRRSCCKADHLRQAEGEEICIWQWNIWAFPSINGPLVALDGVDGVVL